jgi:drug/metabolite transporter (DMT)-like permease
MPYILLILTTLFWSGNFVIGRAVHSTIPPFALSFWRWSLALLILLTFGLKPMLAGRQIIRARWKFFLVQGITGVTGFNSLVYLAMQTTTAINAVLVNSCIPVLIVVLSWLMFRDRLSLRQSSGVCLSLFGVIMIISGGSLNHLLHLQFNIGDLYMVTAATCWALYSANLKNYPKGLHPFGYQTAIVIIGLLFLLPLYLLENIRGFTFEPTAATLATIGYVAVFASVLAFIFWNRAVAELGANIAGPFIHLMPVFSTILAVIFLDERLTANHVRAIVLIFSGILLTTYRRGRSLK